MRNAASYLFFLSLLSVVLTGCFRTELVKPDYILHDNTKDIIVFTNDTTTYEFEEGNYRVDQEGDSTFIQGKGKRLLEPRILGFMNFEGAINIKNVITIQTSEKTFLTTFTEYFVIIPVTIFLMFIFVLFALSGGRITT